MSRLLLGRANSRTPKFIRPVGRAPIVSPVAVGICDSERGKEGERWEKEIRGIDTACGSRVPQTAHMESLYGRPAVGGNDGRCNEAIRRTRPNVVFFQEATPRIREVPQRSRQWYDLGPRPVTPLPENCDYGALVLTALPVLHAARAPLPATSQGGIS